MEYEENNVNIFKKRIYKILRHEENWGNSSKDLNFEKITGENEKQLQEWESSM